MPLGTEVGIGLGDIVLDGTHLSPSKKGRGTAVATFRPMYCGQTAGLIKMPLDTEVCLGPSHIIRWGPSCALPKRGTAPHQFLAYIYCSQTAGWIKMPLGTKVGIGPGDIELDRDPFPLKRGHSCPTTLRPTSIVARRSPISATAELLLRSYHGKVPILYNGPPFFHLKILLRMGLSGPLSKYAVPWAHPSPCSKRHQPFLQGSRS